MSVHEITNPRYVYNYFKIVEYILRTKSPNRMKVLHTKALCM